MAIICPTVTSETLDGYNKQLDLVSEFSERIHVDLGDGIFTPNKLIDINDITIPNNLIVDIHLMYQSIIPYINKIIELKPNLLIMHAESNGEFNKIADILKKADISVGVALLPETPIALIKPAISLIDHVLIFSGDLGHFGGNAKLTLLSKVRDLKKIKPTLEIGWDGGINFQNTSKLVLGGVDVLNVGGGIHNQPNPKVAYDKLKALAGN